MAPTLRPRQRYGIVAAFVIGACISPHSGRTKVPSPSGKVTLLSRAEVQSIASRPDTALAYDSVARLVSIDDGYNVGIAVVRRERRRETAPADALSHHDITEVYQIIEGSGVFVSGGSIVGGSEMRADSKGVRRVVGPSVRGTGITGGTSIEIGPGDIIVVPPNTPHGFAGILSRQIVYTIVRVDPRRRLRAVDAGR